MTCADSTCHPNQKCISQTGDCSTCTTSGCSACTSNYRDKTDFCNGKICISPCLCNSAGDCTHCDPGYYFSNGNCNECKDSCTYCDSGCFECADAIAKDGTTCRVDSIGYYVRFSVPNIQFNFASPLTSALNIDSLTAKSNQGATIDTSQWTLNTCAVGATSCTIVTNSLALNQLPIAFGFEFSQA